MRQQIYVNLPVKDLARSTEFFTALGFAFNPQAGDETNAMMIVNDDAFVMLTEEHAFGDYVGAAVADAASTREVSIGLSAAGRDEVDALIAKARAAGAGIGDLVDRGPMYMQPFIDPDGHRWASIFMDFGQH